MKTSDKFLELLTNHSVLQNDPLAVTYTFSGKPAPKDLLQMFAELQGATKDFPFSHGFSGKANGVN